MSGKGKNVGDVSVAALNIMKSKSLDIFNKFQHYKFGKYF